MEKNVQFFNRQSAPSRPLIFDESKCVGCNRCLEACQIDVMLPNETKGRPPVVAYPDECWYCGCCVMECAQGAIELQHPLMNRTKWVEKSSLGKNGGD